MGIRRIVCVLVICAGLIETGANSQGFNYQEALTKSLIFLECQRSGKLPTNNRVPWRGDSALEDGNLANVDLSGGYYDAGDNVKYGMPMAFTITTLAWAAIAYSGQLEAAHELQNTRDAIRWGTDYFLKAAATENCLYVQVGDATKDHECWVRPENMKTERTVLKIDDNQPGTEIAAETAAAMAASSIVFRDIDSNYSTRLLIKAESLFRFARSHKGSYDGECPFYCSYSGYNDELLWAATWLYKATRKSEYLDYVRHEAISTSVNEFNWDLKFVGGQVLLTEMFFQGEKGLETYKPQADNYICSVLPDSPSHQVFITPGGMVHARDGANSQYVTGTAFIFSLYSDILATYRQFAICTDKQFDSGRIMAFAKQQVDYLLGSNPRGRSYMVDFGNNPPQQAHHRGASIPMSAANEDVSCPMSFVQFYNNNVSNPNQLTGAIVGGPDRQDNFQDLRVASSFTEPCTYVNSMIVGVLAKLAAH